MSASLSQPETDTAGSLLVEERTEFAFEDGDHEKFSHYVDKNALMEATVFKKPCVALCGKKWVPTRDGMKFPVCPDCKAIYDGIPNGDDAGE